MVETVNRPARTRAETRREQRRSLIIAAAEEQLGEAGLAGTTLASVGDRVGLSKGALYYYVDSRDDLLAMVLDDALRSIRDEADANLDDDPSPLDELRAFAQAHVGGAVHRSVGPLIVGNVDELAAHEPTARLLRDHELHARAIVDRAVEAGLLRPVNPVVASAVLFGALNTLPRSYDPNGPLELAELVDQALELLLTGWRAT